MIPNPRCNLANKLEDTTESSSDGRAVRTSSIQYLHSTGPLPLGQHFMCSVLVLLPDYPPSQRIMPRTREAKKRSPPSLSILIIICLLVVPIPLLTHTLNTARRLRFLATDPLAREPRIAVAVQLAADSALAVELNPAGAVRSKGTSPSLL